MTETKNEYEILVREKARALEKKVSGTVRHGNEGFCPRCGNVGLYDLKEKGLSSSSIFYSALFEEWRCPMCEFESLGL